jgi:hypothetical protein
MGRRLFDAPGNHNFSFDWIRFQAGVTPSSASDWQLFE